MAKSYLRASVSVNKAGETVVDTFIQYGKTSEYVGTGIYDCITIIDPDKTDLKDHVISGFSRSESGDLKVIGYHYVRKYNDYRGDN